MSIKVKKIIAVVLAISSLLALCSCSVGREKIDLENFITIEFSKYNGYGTVDLDVDEDSIEDLIDAEKAVEFYNELRGVSNEAALALAFIDSYTDFFKVELAEDYENLENGDKVKVIVTSRCEELGYELKDVEKGLGIKFKDTEITYKVEGLVDAKTLDVFEGIEDCISYIPSGYSYDEDEVAISGEARATVVIPDDFERVVDGMYFVKGDYSNTLKVVYNNERLDTISFSIDGTNTNLSSGDKITVVVTGGSGLEEFDYLIPQLTKEYTVPELAKRLESKSQLTATKMAEIKAEALEYAKEKIGSSNVYDTYYFTIKPSSDANIKCGVIAIVNYTGWFSSGYKALNIYPVILSDGTWEYEIHESSNFNTLEEISTDSFDVTNYTYEKI